MYVATDLHGHSFFSDGRHGPEEYVEHRRALGLRVVALSDHDVLTGVPRAAAAAARAGIVLVPAAEVTAFLHFGTPAAEQIHVLAYYPPAVAAAPRLRRTRLHQRGERVQARWRDFVLAWMDDLSADDRRAIDPDGVMARLDPADFPALQPMFDRVIARRRSRFEALRDHHARFWEEERELFGWEPEEAIDFIRADGAVDVVAHPARYRDRERARRVMQYATGIEVYTSRHRPEVAAEHRAFAEQHDKIWTASSDDHQNGRYARPPSGTPVAALERILRRSVPVTWAGA